MRKLSPTVEEIEALRKTAPSGPVVMINLLKFKPEGGRDAYMKYLEIGNKASIEVINDKPERTPKVIYSGAAGKDVANGEDWDFVIIVEFPSFDIYADIMVHPIYQNEAIPLRNPALEKTLFLVSFPSDTDSIPGKVNRPPK